MSKDFNNPTRIMPNIPYTGSLNTYGDNWFYIQFTQSGKAVFEVDPTSGLDVSLYIYNRNDENLAISINGGQGDVERIEYNATAGEWIRMDVQYSSGAGDFILKCTMNQSQPQDENINEDQNIIKHINAKDIHWYYVQFEENGNANFYLEPKLTTLDVDLKVYKGSKTGELIGSSSKGSGQADLISNKPVIEGVKYFIRVYGYSGTGNYLIRCKNYPNVSEAYVIAGIEGEITRIREKPDFYSSKYYGSVSFEEKVTVLDEEGPFTKIEYSTSSGLKQGYIYSKYLQPFKVKNQPNIVSSVGNWYNPYRDGYEMNQAFNDLDTNLKGHLGHDLFKEGNNVPVKAIFGGTVISAGYSGKNGYMVQIKHQIGNKEFYSFYSHMKANSFTVNTTDKKNVIAGQTLGFMGATGGNWGPHIHLGVYTGAKSNSPYGYYSSGSQHIVNFDEANSSHSALALQNATIVSATKSSRTYYDFQEVIRTNGTIIQ
ncbi:M23 family metallopeptidase [Vallitalea sp.]|jgi:murein DD-endopeptidase MepM/ murein hydrolase activator NlpD|uniref:M23 family metallopeptidase n=1 Tax=Vallitalea sp. TaxID=1882829 RepID=UPI0025F6A793|nr:M23 family metallopeptidase [Vallitalea sp.]MCT4687509.1 M23 family metallopeptidase [Vallitalea sp.]